MTLVSRPVGPRALLVETGDETRALSLAQWVRRTGIAADEVVPAATTVLLDGVPDLDAARERLRDWPDVPPVIDDRLVELPVVYDGPDLAFAADAWGVSTSGAVALHTGHEFVVAFCGFAPGFAYLRGLPQELALPRLATPRTRVPAGAVAVADRWTGVYPSASPGGWRLLGHTEVALFDAAREEPALLAPGTRVRLVAR